MFVWTGHFAHRPKSKADDYDIQHDSKLTPLPTDKFKAVPSLNRALTDAISFQYVKRNGWYITCKNRVCHIEPKKRTMAFERQSSFYPLINFWYDGYTVFESTTKAGFYLRYSQHRLVLDQYDGTELFKQEASFKTNRPDITAEDDLSTDNLLIQSPASQMSRDDRRQRCLLTTSSSMSPLLCPCCSGNHHLETSDSVFTLSVNSLYSLESGHDTYRTIKNEHVAK